MKLLKMLSVFILLVVFGCGGSQKVITDNGEVYTIKNNKYYKNGTNITQELSNEETQNIETSLDNRLEADKQANKRLEKFEDEIKEIDEVIADAEKKRDQIVRQQKQFQNNQKELNEARENALDAKKRLYEKESEYKKLEAAGKLSPNDKLSWEAKLKELENKATEANQVYQNLI